MDGDSGAGARREGDLSVQYCRRRRACFGSLGIRRNRLGVAGVLFAGIFFGQIEMHIDERILEFVRDFGLSLFVYTVGLQSGPVSFLR